MINFLKRLFFRKPRAKQMFRIVCDNELNRSNDFWRGYIHQEATIISLDPDGLVTVKLHDQPIPVEGVDPARFTGDLIR